MTEIYLGNPPQNIKTWIELHTNTTAAMEWETVDLSKIQSPYYYPNTNGEKVCLNFTGNTTDFFICIATNSYIAKGSLTALVKNTSNIAELEQSLGQQFGTSLYLPNDGKIYYLFYDGAAYDSGVGTIYEFREATAEDIAEFGIAIPV